MPELMHERTGGKMALLIKRLGPVAVPGRPFFFTPVNLREELRELLCGKPARGSFVHVCSPLRNGTAEIPDVLVAANGMAGHRDPRLPAGRNAMAKKGRAQRADHDLA